MQKVSTRDVIVMALLVALVPQVGLAQQMFIYPDRGQTPEQQSRDRWECHNWAVQQTGFDPSAPQMAQAAPPPPSMGSPPPGGGAFGGAARGAALGAVGGAIGGDAGKGAAIGAAVGGLFGAMRRAEYMRQQEEMQMQYQHQMQAGAAQQSAARSGAQANYNRAFRVCMNGRGYQVG